LSSPKVVFFFQPDQRGTFVLYLTLIIKAMKIHLIEFLGLTGGELFKHL